MVDNHMVARILVGRPSPFNYGYSYDSDGNIGKRTNVNNGTNWTYAYGDAAHDHAVTGISGGLTASFAYDNNGNMTARTIAGVAYGQKFDVENRLETVTVNGQTTRFVYDAEGNRLLTIQPDGVKVYTSFPEFEETVDGSSVTKRSFYYLAGQLIAVRVDGTSANDDVYYYAYADHLGSIVAWSWTGGTPPVNGYLSRYEPFGGYRTRPDVAANPAISSRGFTGHRGNNAGEQDIQNLNLIYMNARYYMPEIGRFISADTIVPEPEVPQSYNRYGYSINNPIRYTDPTGHMHDNGSQFGGGSSQVEQNSSGCENVFELFSSFEQGPVIKSATPKQLPALSNSQQQAVKLLNMTTVASDVIAFGFSGGGALVEVGLAAIDTASPLGDLGGLAAYYEMINPIENAASLAGFASTFAGDLIEGVNYVQSAPLEVSIGQDTLVSGIGIILGNGLPLEGALDTLVNVPLMIYDFQSAVGHVPTCVELQWNVERGTQLIVYP